MGLFYLIATVICSLTIAQVLKVIEINNYKTVPVLVINYLTASLFAASTSSWELTQFDTENFPIIGLAILLGVLFIANFFVYSKSIHQNGMGISITAMRMSLVLPIALSIWVYNEYITQTQTLGVLITFASLVLLLPPKPIRFNKRWILSILPLLLFLFTGLAESGLKVFEQSSNGQFDESNFLAIVFSTSFCIGLIYMIYKKLWRVSKKEIVLGVTLGIFNLYSSYFLLLALLDYPGAIVFPAVNLLTIVFGTTLGFLVWKDKISKRQWVGLVFALVSIYLIIG